MSENKAWTKDCKTIEGTVYIDPLPVPSEAVRQQELCQEIEALNTRLGTWMLTDEAGVDAAVPLINDAILLNLRCLAALKERASAAPPQTGKE